MTNTGLSFVVRNLESGYDSKWIELDNMTEQEARAEWDKVVNPNYDWEIVDLECNFSVNYYEFQYASFNTLYKLFLALSNAIDDGDYGAALAEALLLEGTSANELEEAMQNTDAIVILADGSEDTDLAYAIIDEFGWEGVDLVEYFDYDAFGEALVNDGYVEEFEHSDPEYYEYLSNLTDFQLAEHYIESLGGEAQLHPQTLEAYFDYEQYGRALAWDYTFVTIGDVDAWVRLY